MLKIIFQKFKEYLATRKSELQPVRIRAKKIKRRTRLQFRINLFEAISAWAAEKKEQNKNKLYLDEDSDYVKDWFTKEFPQEKTTDTLVENVVFVDEGVTFSGTLTDAGVEFFQSIMNPPELQDTSINIPVRKVISDETLDYIQKETDVSVLKMLHEETEDPEIQKMITNRIKEVVNEKKNKRRVQRPKRKASVPLQSAQSAV